MKVIGLIGGMSWNSSLEYYRLINELVSCKLGRLHSARLVLYSLDFEEIELAQRESRHPELVSRLVIVDIGPEISATGIERMERERASEPEVFDSEEEVISYMRRIEPRQSDKFIRHQVRYALRQDERGGLRFKYDRALLSTELRSPQWLWEYVSQVVCPSLLVHGMASDMLAREVAERMGRSLAFGSVVDIEHAGHSVPGDNPEAFEVAVCRFLDIRRPSAT